MSLGRERKLEHSCIALVIRARARGHFSKGDAIALSLSRIYFRRRDGLYRSSLRRGRGNGRLTRGVRSFLTRFIPLASPESLELSSWEDVFGVESPHRRSHPGSPISRPWCRASSRPPTYTTARMSMFRVELTKKVVAFCPEGTDRFSRATRSNRVRDGGIFRDISRGAAPRRPAVIQVHILNDSPSRINATFPAGDVSLPTCSATLPMPREKIGFARGERERESLSRLSPSPRQVI